MRNHDIEIRTMSRWRVTAWLAFVLALSSCGSKTKLAKPDGGPPDTGSSPPTGGEVGPEAVSEAERCLQQTNPPECDRSTASMTISSAAGGPLLAKVEVMSGSCYPGTCTRECSTIGVSGDMSMSLGSTCELRVTAVNGRSQTVTITLKQNPTPSYHCCRAGGSQGSWIDISTPVFEPGSVVVDLSVRDGGADLGDGPDIVRRETAGVDRGPDLPDGPDLGDRPDLQQGPELPPASDLKPDVFVLPTDEATCIQTPNVPACEPPRPQAVLSAKASGPLLSKVEVVSGPCAPTSCASGCASLTVVSTSSAAGVGCDLVITAGDGRKQTVRLTTVSNPSPTYACCGYPLPPSTGRWVAIDPAVFSPGQVTVDFDTDGGVPLADGGRD